MNPRAILIGLAIMLPLLFAGLLLWRSQGVMVWLQGAIAYCF